MRALISLVVLCLTATPAFGQDVVKVDPKHYTVLFDNAVVRVLRATQPPGDKGVMHDHPQHVLIPLTEAHVRFTSADGTTQERVVKAETPVIAPATRHVVENIGKNTADVIVVELKRAAGTKPAVAASQLPGITVAVVAEAKGFDVIRVKMDRGFHEPGGSTHPYDAVVVPLNTTDFAYSIGSDKAERIERGKAFFIGRGVSHEMKTGSTPVDLLAVRVF
jgi:quercetin dioxygenase-like cupin family protein